jgi:hypothetical protein
VFYLESFQPDLNATPWFPDLMRLFNIRYIFSKTLAITTEFLQKCNLIELMKLDNETHIFIRSPDQVYGYFEFVNVPGMVQGNLKAIREAVRSLTQIYQVSAVLAINPDSQMISKPPAEVSVSSNIHLSQQWIQCFSWLLHHLLSPHAIPVTKWTFNGYNVSEDVFLESVMNLYLWQPVRSRVLKESTKTNEYSAIVEIPQESFSKVR